MGLAASNREVRGDAMAADGFGQEAPGDLLIPGLGMQQSRHYSMNVSMKFVTLL